MSPATPEPASRTLEASAELYAPKTDPWLHQSRAFARFKDSPYAAVCFEQRCGKSKPIIDIAAYAYERFLALGGWPKAYLQASRLRQPPWPITGLLVVAMPGRVHRNWVVNEIPAHLPDRIPRACATWEAQRIRWDPKRKAFAGSLLPSLERLLAFEGLSILAVNGEALVTTAFRRFLPKFLKSRQLVMVVDDEFTLVNRTPGIGRTRVMEAIAKRPEVVRRYILDGTPNGGSPLDCFAPYRFLSPDIFGTTSYTVFKHRYALWKKETDWQRGHQYERLDRGEDGTSSPWINVEELRGKIAPYTERVLFKECFDTPPKIYQTLTYQPSPEQRRVYDDLVSEFEAELSNGQKISAPLALTRYLRMQQVLTNVWPSEQLPTIHSPCNGEGCEACNDLGVILTRTKPGVIDRASDPRMEAMEQFLSLNTSAGIVWARFTRDVDRILELAKRLGRSPCRYDGLVSNRQKDQAQDGFQAGVFDLMVGKKKSGGRGIKLSKADWICTFTEEFSLLGRLQGEDRAEAAEKRTSTGIVDILAEDTIDDLIIYPALRQKKNIADFVNGDRKGKWI